MATREENLKKINDELEKLDDEQLDKIAGGFSEWKPDAILPTGHIAPEIGQKTFRPAD